MSEVLSVNNYAEILYSGQETSSVAISPRAASKTTLSLENNQCE